MTHVTDYMMKYAVINGVDMKTKVQSKLAVLLILMFIYSLTLIRYWHYSNGSIRILYRRIFKQSSKRRNSFRRFGHSFTESKTS